MKRVVAIILVITVILFGINDNRVGAVVYAGVMESMTTEERELGGQTPEEANEEIQEIESQSEEVVNQSEEIQGIDNQVVIDQKNQYEKNYIVGTKNKTKLKDVKTKFKKGNTITTASGDYIKDENLTVISGCEKDIQKLEKDADVLFVEEDYLVEASSRKIKNRNTIKKEAGKLEWNVSAIKATSAIKVSSNKVKVAILDSGVDAFDDIEIEDAINLIPGEEEILPLFWDISGHGSSVAGIIAAKDDDQGITGINPNVKIYVAKVLSAGNVAPVSRVVEGIYWAIDNDVDIINISFGLETPSQALELAIKDAYNKGILIIAAAGNNGSIEYPAAYDEVMAVGSVDTDGIVSDYSAKGDEIDVVAPGEQIKSTGGFGGTVICEGTSMAAPHVTAIASILWQKDKNVSNEFIRQLINASANGYGDEESYGNGLVDLNRAEEIYKTFKKNFSKKNNQEQNEEGILENTSPVLQFENIDYVEGSWKGAQHLGFVTSAGTDLSAAAIQRIKAGAVYPDFGVSGMAGMGSNPYWHGYYKGDDGVATNYINAYIFTTRMAQAIRGGNGVASAVTPDSIRESGNYTAASAMRADVNSINYSQAKTTLTGTHSALSGLVLNSSDQSQKAQFVWGMAIHGATDVFAHSVYGYVADKNIWTRFFHETANGNEYADDKTVTTWRLVVANEVASNIVRRYKSNQAGDYTQFTDGCSYSYNEFLLFYLSKYLEQASGSSQVGNKFSLYSYQPGISYK